MTGSNGTSEHTSGGGEGGGASGGRGRSAQRAAIAEETLEKLFGKLPPHSEEAEIALLGSLMLDASVIGDIIMHVNKPEQFYGQQNGQIFQAMLDLHNETRAIDLVPLAELLKGRGVIGSADAAAFLVSLAEAVPSARNALHYARIVADRARLRRLISTAGEIMRLAFSSDESAGENKGAEIVDTAEQMIFEIASEGDTAGPERLSELLRQEIVRIEMQAEGKGVSGVPTGFMDLDDKLGGLQPGEMLILAARPSMGKTALSLNLAEQVAFGGRTPWSPRDEGGEHAPVGFFSLEMSREALVQRLLSARSGIDAHKIRTGDLGGGGMSAMEAWDRINDAAAELYEAPLFIDDSPGLTILQLRAKARRMAERHDLKLIVIDYLQLLTAPGAARESRQVEVSTISRQIKALARELKVPVLCLAQLNRGAEQRERNRPRMSDLRESGSIEQDADVVMLLHREAYYHKDDEEWLNDPDNEEKLTLSELIIAKQRNGPTGVVKLTWDDKTVRFKNHDSRHGGYGGVGVGGYGVSPGGTAPPFDADPPGVHVNPPSSFAPGRPTGPVADHRDGGGPDTGLDAYEDLPPV